MLENSLQSKYKKNILLYYMYVFFGSMRFERGIFILYLTEKGFTNTQIGFLQSILFFSMFLFEFPTGYLGDKLGRKFSILCGLFLICACGIGMISFNEYYIFIILFIFNGISSSFISGSDTALLYDSLKLSGGENKYLKINSQISAINSVVLGMSIFLGGYMKLISWTMVYISYTLAMLIAFIVVLFMYENISDYKVNNSIEDRENTFSNQIKLFFLKNNNKLLLLFIFAYAFFESAMTPFYIYGQKLLSFYELKANYISTIYSIIQFTSGITLLFAEKISSKFSLKKLIVIDTSITALLLFTNIINNKYLAIVVFFIINANAEILFIIKDAYIQENIESSIRASLLSFFSFIEVLFISMTYIIIGYFMDSIKINYAISLLMILPILSLILFSCFFCLKNKISNSIYSSNENDKFHCN